MYAPAVTPRPITSSNLHTKKGGVQLTVQLQVAKKKKMLRLKLLCMPHSSGQIRGMAARDVFTYPK
jgi:hypothetical protein